MIGNPFAELALGTPIEHIETPCLWVDLDQMERNVTSIVDACRARQVNWRPHVKSHKSRWVSEQLVKAGAIGITCAKVSEAAVFAGAAIPEVLIANLVVGPVKCRRVAELAQQMRTIVCVDHVAHLEPLSQAAQERGTTVSVLVELDIGMQRVGVTIGPEARRLIDETQQCPGVEFAGVMAYEGHLLTISDPNEKRRRICETLEPVITFRQQLMEQGIPCPIVSCGGTGSFEITSTIAGVTELQAGGAILMDAFYREACGVVAQDYALFAEATVVSTPTPTRAVVDAGRKTLDAAIHRPLVVGLGETTVESLSAEHGILRVDPNHPLRIGQRIRLVPGYSDLTLQLHDTILGIRKNCVERIISIDGRGCIR